MHFLSIYCSDVMLPFLTSRPSSSEQNTPFDRGFFVSFCSFFCDVLSSHYYYRQYRPSLLAAVCFVITRKAMQMKWVWESDVMIRPVWEECYAEWMQVNAEEVLNVVETLWREYTTNYPDHCQAEMVATPRNALLT